MKEHMTGEVIAHIPPLLFRQQEDGWVEARTSLSKDQTTGYRVDSVNGTAIAGLIDMGIVAACKMQRDVTGPTYNFGPKKIRFHIPPGTEIVIRAKVTRHRFGVCHVEVEILDNNRTLLCGGSGNLKEDKPKEIKAKDWIIVKL
jgi:acyl-coenzyme A thioesterase PaaI-like protein